MFKRESNFELLRIICMMSILSLHFVSQSKVKEVSNCSNWFYIVMQSYGRIACTVFFMISAWFLCETKYSLTRIVKTELCAAFYGILFLGGAKLLNIECGEITVIKAITPTISGSLWFVMVYIELLFLSPIFNIAIDILDRNISRQIIFIPLVTLMLYSTILKDVGRIIKEIVFFPIVYLTIKYVKKYNVFEKVKTRTWFFIGILSWISIQLLIMSNSYIKDPEVATVVFEYGSYFRSRFWTIPNFVCAFCSFMLFKNITIPANGVINCIASPTLGIYLIHQNPIFYPVLWNYLVTRYESLYVRYSYLAILVTVILLYILCGIIEQIRSRGFNLLYNYFYNVKKENQY